MCIRDSFNDEICDYDHCPSWCVFDQTLFEAGPMSTRQGDWFECGNFTTMLPDELRDWEAVSYTHLRRTSDVE